jgi:hypothetical protein
MNNRFVDMTASPDAAATAEESRQHMKIAAGNALGRIKAAVGSAIKDTKNAARHQVEAAREKRPRWAARPHCGSAAARASSNRTCHGFQAHSRNRLMAPTT